MLGASRHEQERGMKRFTVLVAALALTAAVGTGCATAKRDLSTPAAALLGHWENVSPGTNADVYYGPDTVYYFGGSTKPVETSYEIVSEDTDGFALEVRYGEESGDPTKIGFSEDRNEITVYPSDVPELLKYRYVDDKQSPVVSY